MELSGGHSYSPCSFYTARSSPVSDVAMTDVSVEDQKGESASSPPLRYRRGIPVTDEIRKHCHIFFDEQLYSSALLLLSDLVTSGTSHPDADDRAAFVPIPYHIELVSTLLVHPRYTNQSPPDERHDLASKAITFLRNTLCILGPVNANLAEAFSFGPFTTTRGSRRSRNAVDKDEYSSGSDSDDKPENMKGVIANTGRIQRCAKDFWHIVGWAFNCSVKYPKRWQYWKVYLEYMLDVLDEDWQERERLDRENTKDLNATCKYEIVRQGLFVKYLSDIKGRSSAMKRVVRSIFADGNPHSLKEFPEVFENETKEVVYNGQKRKRASTIDQPFEDLDNEEGEIADPSSSQIEEKEDEEEALPEVDSYLGGTDSVALRQRFLTLFSRASYYLPDCFTGVIDLYDAIFISIKPIPVPAFSLFMSPSTTSGMSSEVFVSLACLLLLRLLPNGAPRPTEVTKSGQDDITQDVLQECFLPWPANTTSAEDNAKVSIMTENCFRLFLRNCPCWHTPELGEAVEKGILARERKIKSEKKYKEPGAKKRQDTAKEWLKASGERLRSLLAFVEMKTAHDWSSD